MTRGPDAATLLERGLLRAARDAGVSLTVDAADWTRWASVTFTGARHDLWISAPHSAALDSWLADLGEQEFRLRGHVVADLAVAEVRRDGAAVRARIEALTVESR
jgi:hypothetical protein